MSDTKNDRSRHGNVLNLSEVKGERWEKGERYGVTSQEVALAIGARDLGFCVVSLDPGRRSCPYHFHHSEEELFYVLEGQGRLRQGKEGEEEEWLDLAPGDFVSYPPGTGVAHQFFNESDAPFVYLALSNRLKHDVAEYPDSNKINVRGVRMLLRREPRVDYFDGEL